MKILILSFYYYPDLCAGSFRNTSFANTLKKDERISHIDIATTMPNRYSSYLEKAPKIENLAKVKINRFDIGLHNNGMLDQSRSFFNFARSVLKYTKDKNYDLIYASSSRLMTAFLGALISKRKNIPLYLDIRDIFSDILFELIPKPISYIIYFPIKLIEKFTVNQSVKLNLVSEGFKEYFIKNYNQKYFSFIPNGIDDEFLNIFKIKNKVSSEKVCLYAGNIGEGQGLDKILPMLSSNFDSWVFKVIGAGGALEKLKFEIKKNNVKNIKLIPPMSRDKLIKEYANSTILFIHLNTYKSFEKVLPSKIFEYAATGKPIIAGVKGYTKSFIEKEINNAMCFEPGNVHDAVNCIKNISLKKVDRKKFIKNYSRRNLSKLLVKDVLSSVK